MGSESNPLSVDAPNLYIDSVAKPRRAFRHSIQHRLNIRRRAGDHAQNLARRRLLFQCFGELPVAGIEFVEQADVLDGDDRLASKCLQELDLFIRKRANFGSAN